MLYTLKTVDGDDILIDPRHVVRIYKVKGKVSLVDGSVLRVRPSDLERLIIKLENPEMIY